MASRALPLGALLPDPPDPPCDALDFVLSDALLFEDEPSALAVPLAPFAPVGSVAPFASLGAMFAAASFIVGAVSSSAPPAAPGPSESVAAARAILLVWTRWSRGAGSASRVRARRCADGDGWVVRRCVEVRV